jgi:hypothetical protein
MYRFEFAPKPSKWLFFILFVLHGLAFAALICANIVLILQILLGAVLLLSGYRCCWLWALQRGSKAILRCVATLDRWWLIDRLGHEYEVRLAGESLVTTVLIILNFQVVSSGAFAKRPRLILAPDSLDANTLRRLRVFLLSH